MSLLWGKETRYGEHEGIRGKFLGMSATGGAGPMGGWKDAFGANPNRLICIRQSFELPEGASVPRKHVYHSNILAREVV